jgi:hypothetical protein
LAETRAFLLPAGQEPTREEARSRKLRTTIEGVSLAWPAIEQLLQ